MLLCPKCNLELKRIDNTYTCEAHHCYDVAKRGYVNLLIGNHKATGDDKDMVKARTNFLANGYYKPLQAVLLEELKKINPGVLVDAGCGEGYYTNEIAKLCNQTKIYGFDLSKFAVDEACKAKLAITYGVCSVFHMPLSDSSTDVVLSVFAPFDSNENARILKEDGYFIRVAPGKQHLMEMKQILYQDVYENEKLDCEYAGFTLEYTKQLEYEVTIHNQQDIWALFQMTPYYWKTPKEGSERLKACSELHTTVAFEIQVFKKI